MTPPQTASARMTDAEFDTWLNAQAEWWPLAAEARSARESEAKALEALRLVVVEMVLSGNASATDFGWQQAAYAAREVFRAAGQPMPALFNLEMVAVPKVTPAPPLDRCPMGDDVYCEDCSARPTCNVPKGSTKPLRLEPESKRG